jgi:hypothetical protein
MTYVFEGTPDDQMKGFFDRLAQVKQQGPYVSDEFREAMASLVGLLDRQARLGTMTPERVERFWGEACDALSGVAADATAYVHFTLITADDANDDEWYDLCIRRTAIELVREHCPFLEPALEQAGLSIAEIDAELRRVGEDQGPVASEYVPAGMPDSHWWWKHPDRSGGTTT